jgi:hypothetical protein
MQKAIEPFELLLVFTRTQSKSSSSHDAFCDLASRVNHSEEYCPLGCYLIYLCLIKHIAGLH